MFTLYFCIRLFTCVFLPIHILQNHFPQKYIPIDLDGMASEICFAHFQLSNNICVISVVEVYDNDLL